MNIGTGGERLKKERGNDRWKITPVVLSSGICLHTMTTIAPRTHLHGILSHMVSAWHMFPCPDPRLFSMCHLIVNTICFPNVPYDVPTVSHGHICSIQSYPPIWFATCSLWCSPSSHLLSTFVLWLYPICFATCSL